MINRVNGFILDFPIVIDKSKLPKRNFMPYEEKNFSPNDKKHFIKMNRYGNKAELQKTANLLSESNVPFASFWGIEDGWG